MKPGIAGIFLKINPFFGITLKKNQGFFFFKVDTLTFARPDEKGLRIVLQIAVRTRRSQKLYVETTPY